jgi:hypothetical protein
MLRIPYSRSLRVLALAAALLTTASSCNKDLDQKPSYLAGADVIYRDPAQIQQVLARLYATLSVSGQNGSIDRSDLSFINADYVNYVRGYWKLQELTSDEAHIAWGDAGLPELNNNTWNADNQFIRGMYEKIFFQVAGCNDFLRNTTDEKLSGYGIGGAELGNIKQYRAEARFLRALSYYHALDMFGNVPFADETFAVGTGTLPPQKSRAELFAFIESELKAIEAALPAPRASYARADQAVAWTLLTKLYLNAEVYTGTARNNDAVTYSSKVLGAGYVLSPNYRYLFMADNDKSAARNEIIFPITFDGMKTQNFGGTSFLVHATVGGSMSAAEAGINGGWYGIRARKNLVELFPGAPSSTDDRALFYTAGQNIDITTPSDFTNGFAMTKWRNVTSDGKPGSGYPPAGSGDFVDTDFPLFRLADVQLMYAEAVLRGGTGGTAGTALSQVNAVRARSHAPALASVELSDILNERGRELYWEGHRRTDLIRFKKYTTGYNWAFKGGVKEGKDIEAFRTLFPLPNTDLVANPGLKQNPGY